MWSTIPGWCRASLPLARRATAAIVCLLAGVGPAIAGGPAAAGPGAGSPAGPAVVAAGSGANLGIVRLLAAAFHRKRPDVTVEVPASIGSTGAVRAVAKGAVPLGLVSRPLSPAELALGLTVVPYARTAVVLGVHPDVTDEGLTYDELVAIYRGAKRTWRNGREIVLLTREPGDSSIEVLEREVPGFRKVYADVQRARRWTTLVTDQEMNRVLARTSAALGLTDLGTMAAERLPIKALRLNGVAPSPEAVRAGRYPLVKTLAFVFHAERLPEAARAFRDFVRSPDGERVLAGYGYLRP